jgi:hypothetical protein
VAAGLEPSEAAHPEARAGDKEEGSDKGLRASEKISSRRP